MSQLVATLHPKRLIDEPKIAKFNSLTINAINIVIFQDTKFFNYKIAFTTGTDNSPPILSAKKKSTRMTSPLPRERWEVIRLCPSPSDYETFVKTTAIAMGRSVGIGSTVRPNMRLLSLLNLGS